MVKKAKESEGKGIEWKKMKIILTIIKIWKRRKMKEKMRKRVSESWKS